jgi:hypothetical protein
MRKTIFFEEEYGVSMDDIKSTEEVDAIIEKKNWKKIESCGCSHLSCKRLMK